MSMFISYATVLEHNRHRETPRRSPMLRSARPSSRPAAPGSLSPPSLRRTASLQLAAGRLAGAARPGVALATA